MSKRSFVIGLVLLALASNSPAQQAPQEKNSTAIAPLLKVRHDFMVHPVPAKVPANFYAQNLPFFCRQELKLQKAHLPLMFRVGTVDECDRLEGKRK